MATTEYSPETLNYYMRYFSEWMGAPSNFLQSIAEIESGYNSLTGDFNNGCAGNPFDPTCGLMQLKDIAVREAASMGYNLDKFNPVQAIIGAVILFYKNDLYMKSRGVINPDWPTRVIAYNQGWTAGVKFAQTHQAPNKTASNYLSTMAAKTGIA